MGQERYAQSVATLLCELRLRPIVYHDSNHNQQEFEYNHCHSQGLGREPKALPRGNALQILLVLGKESLLLQFVFLKGQFLIGNEPRAEFD